MDYLKIADRTWPALTRLMGGHARIYRATGGRIGGRLPGLRQMLLLDHVGAKSGIKRTAPLLYVRDGENVVIVGSKGGFERHPAWFHNLRANPDTTVQIGSEVISVRTHVANAEERAPYAAIDRGPVAERSTPSPYTALTVYGDALRSP